MGDTRSTTYWAAHAWLPSGWAEGVVMQVGPDGRWAGVETGIAQCPSQARELAGLVLPGLVDAHSHALQRAFAGLAERRETGADDFWSWRDRMYRVALRIDVAQLRAVAAQLFLELLEGGYTQVCEFHYLQHAPDGTPYPDPYVLSWALCDAAAEAGIGLTLMPALYERAGFAQPHLRADQRRFRTTPREVIAHAQAIERAGRPNVRAGLAVHSLRAASADSIHALADAAQRLDGPMHVHVAEQTGEVDDCLAATGMRPVQWLAERGLLDARWQLVHATHVERAEIDAVARSGAGVVICPATEANLGDGLTDLPGWLDAGVPLSIGSDSHVSRDAREELRWLEYGQRLALRRRNVAAQPGVEPSTAARLWRTVQQAGAAASGEPAWGLLRGARADLIVVDAGDPSLSAVPASQLLDGLVFSSPGRPFTAVMCAGRWVVLDGRHVARETVTPRFSAAMHRLWATG